MKNEAYEKLVRKLQEVEPNANKETVKSKVNTLRGSFRREFKKVADSKRSGTGSDDIYEPHLWYYTLLYFVNVCLIAVRQGLHNVYVNVRYVMLTSAVNVNTCVVL